MEMLSNNYGWTPDQIRSMDEGDIRAYLDILFIKNKHEINQIKKIR